ncbi:glycoside hydrolase family 88 protein [Pedobacter insulae]|uniref:Glycosyl Hydrolase Family 88 n=1 Tax=Pedobacter insulae TaxID=414048 RepID=A0A1I2UX33_9SPHI|nr:glycoside hydrolase family 88 protein [Pedobacter insulae]SFG81675.1 Glycosyl Hydrolase Family 88 [Pedobacter insulae]
MKLKTPIYIATLLTILHTSCVAQQVRVNQAFDHAIKQTKILLEEIEKNKTTAKPELVSPRTIENGKLKLVASKDWTSGFFPGVLWYLYEFSQDKGWLPEAREYSAAIEAEKNNGVTHDMGFKVYCSIGNGYRLTNDSHYRDILITAAKTLATRFNPKTGVILSWDHSRDKWVNPVIIDNMMNLELLFETTKLTGDSSLYKIAVSHANTTIKNHFRADYSSYHVIDYDPNTGVVLKKNTHQGYSHESAWARGQAWALYGYTMAYRYTKDPVYLKQAENVAKFILNHPNLPKDMVPYYDFNAPGIPNEPRDASAAAVISSALYELAQYSNEGKTYHKKAGQILQSLATKYIAPVGSAFGFILLHSTGSKPGNSEIDVPLSYADYYYLEALLRYKNSFVPGNDAHNK